MRKRNTQNQADAGLQIKIFLLLFGSIMIAIASLFFKNDGLGYKIVFYLIGIASIGLGIFFIVHDIATKKSRINMRITDVDLMSGIEFENFVSKLFRQMGYRTQVTRSSGDQGVDILASKDGILIAIQTKCYSGKVGNHSIMEVVGGMKFYNADKCMVVTNSTFTKSAIELAKANDVDLWDRQDLINKLAGW